MPRKFNCNIELFNGINDIDLNMMYSCLGGRKKTFLPGETVFTFDPKSQNTVGIVSKGIVRLERTDYFGDYTLLDRLSENDIFGEIHSYASLSENEISAVCEKECEIIFIDHDRIIHPCQNACGCHMMMLSNLLKMISNKTERLSQRVEVISNKNIRSKLMAYFAMQAHRAGSPTFELPFSVSALADYICVDRSAMMREISKMKKEGLIESNRRVITLINSENY